MERSIGRVARSPWPAIGAVLALLFAACSSAAPAGPTPQLATPVVTSTPTPSATPAATLTPTPAPTPTPSPSPALTASPNPSPAQSPVGSAFTVAGISTSFDQNASGPDPSTFGASFPASSSIYVEFVLQVGLSGTVTGTLDRADGTQVVSTDLDYPAGGPWAWFKITGYPAGEYRYMLRYAATGEEVVLPLTMTGAAASALPSGSPGATASGFPSGSPGTAFTLLTMATSADTSRPAPDPSTYVTAYPQSVQAVYVVFALRGGLTGTVSCDLLRDGTSLLQSPISLTYGTNNAWGSFTINLGGNQPAGTYAATVTYAPTGESQTIEFTLDPVASPSP